MSSYKIIEDSSKYIANTFTSPLTYKLFYSVRYIENIHLYWWLLKDLGWSLGLVDLGITFGIIAIIWICALFYHAYELNSGEEMYFVIAVFLWLLGNFLWMNGELENNDDDIGRLDGRYSMIFGIILIVFYHIFVKILNFFQIKDNIKADKMYNEAGLKSRFSYFTTFRQYELFHIFCWLLKDLCWNANIKVLWSIFVLPTFFISFDFIWLCSHNKKMTIDMCHYISQFIWVSANIIWAYGELFVTKFPDEPQKLFYPEKITYRWFSSVLLVCAWLPIIILYFLWIPLTYFKHINTTEYTETNIELSNVVINPIQNNLNKNSIDAVHNIIHNITENLNILNVHLSSNCDTLNYNTLNYDTNDPNLIQNLIHSLSQIQNTLNSNFESDPIKDSLQNLIQNLIQNLNILNAQIYLNLNILDKNLIQKLINELNYIQNIPNCV